MSEPFFVATNGLAQSIWVVVVYFSLVSSKEEVVKARDVIKLVQADGWYLVRIRGDHRHFKHPEKSGIVTISGQLSKDMPIGTFLSVLKQAQLEKGDERG
jgi:predicted RNA binding protein YcfA (HicA-like mRNA interferase family)